VLHCSIGDGEDVQDFSRERGIAGRLFLAAYASKNMGGLRCQCFNVGKSRNHNVACAVFWEERIVLR